MKPIKMTMTAFCSYSGKTEIDFEKLGKNGFYLISGDTGAGKSTILDAISFALYGEASGDDGRQPGDLRSMYADKGTTTEVVLEFESGGKRYTVSRKLGFKETKTRYDDGSVAVTKKVETKVVFACPEGIVDGNKKQVDSAIKEVVGLDREQFKQVVMVAQGEFEKVLKATSDERVKIFEKIFCTRRYFKLQERLKAEAGKSKKILDALDDEIEDCMKDMDCPEDSPYFADVRAAKEGMLPTNEAPDLVRKLLDSDGDLYNDAEAGLKTVGEQKDRLNADLAKAEAYAEARNSLSEASDKLPDATNRLDEARAAFEAEEGRKGERESLGNRIGAISSQMGEYDALEKSVNEHESLVSEANILDGQNKEAGKSLDERNRKIEDLRNEQGGLKNAESERADADARLQNENRYKKDLSDLQQLLSERDTLVKNYSAADKDYKAKRNVYENLVKEQARMNDAYMEAQAGILAEGLEEGRPCPVCGSRVHPLLASKPLGAPSKDDLDDMKKSVDDADEKKNAALSALSDCESLGRAKRAEIEREASELFIDFDFESLPALAADEMKKCLERIKDLESKLSAADKKTARKRYLDEEIPKMEGDLRRDGESLNEAINKCSAMTSKAGAMRDQIDAARKKLPYPSKAEAQSALNDLKNQKKALDDAYESARENLDRCKNDVSTLNTRIDEANKTLGSCEPIDEKETAKALNELKGREVALSIQKEDAHARLAANGKVKDRLDAALKDRDAAKEEFAWKEKLSATMNGAVPGRTRKRLEAYVQETYFDRTLSLANSRLLTMSEGQYMFERSEEGDRLDEQVGLGLNIVDGANGSRRNVRTLSGGEAFQASLALALGLSDTINDESGGIRIESMFIDEGFGSLSEERLNLTVRALASDMRDNRIVGIISHVEGLKGEFNKQMIVTKDESGSKVEIAVEETE